jgi:hypothetical protein
MRRSAPYTDVVQKHKGWGNVDRMTYAHPMHKSYTTHAYDFLHTILSISPAPFRIFLPLLGSLGMPGGIAPRQAAR